MTSIVVNGEHFTVKGITIDYAAVVSLAHPNRSNPPLMSITYSWQGAGDNNRSGTLYPGKAPIELADGMQFHCYHTGNA